MGTSYGSPIVVEELTVTTPPTLQLNAIEGVLTDPGVADHITLTHPELSAGFYNYAMKMVADFSSTGAGGMSLTLAGTAVASFSLIGAKRYGVVIEVWGTQAQDATVLTVLHNITDSTVQSQITVMTTAQTDNFRAATFEFDLYSAVLDDTANHSGMIVY